MVRGAAAMRALLTRRWAMRRGGKQRPPQVGLGSQEAVPLVITFPSAVEELGRPLLYGAREGGL